MDDFPGNNPVIRKKEEPPNKPKADVKKKKEKTVEKVVVGEVTRKKETISHKFSRLIFNDTAANVAGYIVMDVLIPALKNLAVDATSKGIERLVHGQVSTNRRYGPEPRSRFNYNAQAQRRADREVIHMPDQPPRARGYAVGDIVLTTREDAEHVLERMIDIIDTYDVVSVADFYELLGIPVSSFMDQNWGWYMLTGSDVRQVREGFLLHLPSPVAIRS